MEFSYRFYVIYLCTFYSNVLLLVATKYADYTQAAKHKLHLWKSLPALACRDTNEYSSFTRDWQILVGVVQQIATYFSFLTRSYPLAQNGHKPTCWKTISTAPQGLWQNPNKSDG